MRAARSVMQFLQKLEFEQYMQDSNPYALIKQPSCLDVLVFYFLGFFGYFINKSEINFMKKKFIPSLIQLRSF